MSLPSSMADFVPCDRLLPEAYSVLGGIWRSVKTALNSQGIRSSYAIRTWQAIKAVNGHS